MIRSGAISAEGHEHETALHDSRMRQRQVRVHRSVIAIDEHVDIDDTRPPALDAQPASSFAPRRAQRSSKASDESSVVTAIQEIGEPVLFDFSPGRRTINPR